MTPLSTSGLFIFTLCLGQAMTVFSPCTSSGDRVQWFCIGSIVGSHRVFLIPFGQLWHVFGRRLGQGIAACGTPSALCGAPSGRGHRLIWTVLTWPQDIMPAMMSALQYRHEAPPQHSAMSQGPSFGGFIWSVGFIRTLLVHSLPIIAHQLASRCVLLCNKGSC